MNRNLRNPLGLSLSMRIFTTKIQFAGAFMAGGFLFLAMPNISIAASSVSSTPCTGLAASLTHQPGIKSAASVIVPASDADPSYCKVDIRYGVNAAQNINIVIALPLSAADGGTGRVNGAWNGRTQGLGGGGCTGNLLRSPFKDLSRALASGYVASGNDLGHSGGDCKPAVNPDGTYNMQFIQDFIRNGIKQQVLWSKAVARMYYGVAPRYNYWNGCSTGGRQGYLLAQELGNELEGILAGDPAINWTRFQTAQMWGQIAMRELTGGPIPAGKLEQARVSSVAACDAADGVTDDVIDDPRSCRFSAKANICGAATAPKTDCLTPQEAEAIDLIWDGPRNARNNRIWFGLDRGSSFAGLNGANAFILGVTQFQWDKHDRNFDWRSVPLKGYAEVAESGSRNIADVTDTAQPLDAFKTHGGKLLSIVSLNDSAIFPRGVIHYHRQMATRYGRSEKPNFEALRDFYRLFRAPGFDHCGGQSAAGGAFDSLVEWVERGVAPESLTVSGKSSNAQRTRPICMYPQTAIYKGSGSTDEAKNFHCGGNVETPALVCQDVLTKYRQEMNGDLDFEGSGLKVESCKNQ